ncbi:MAG TPA: hypothetical protein VFI90_11885, partial [Rubrobacter sp.]|nr:hypothetical protein [Rubrobacter sp.]
VLTYAIAWGFMPFGSFGAFGPLIAAFIVIQISQGASGLRELGSRMNRWRVGWVWYVVALGLPFGVHLLTGVAGVGIPEQGFTSFTGYLMLFALRLMNPLDGWAVALVAAAIALRHARPRVYLAAAWLEFGPMKRIAP